MKLSRLLVVLLAAAVCGPAAVARASDQAAQVEPRLTRVALFKNGLGLFTAEVALPEAPAREVAISPLLAASHGTFWVSYDADVKLRDLVARRISIEEMAPASSVQELLSAAVGRRVRLCFSADGATCVEGKLLSLTEGRQPPEPEPYAAGRLLALSGRLYPAPAGRLAVVETEKGVVAFDAGVVQRVDFPDGDVPLSVPVQTEATCLVARLDRPAPGRVLTISYLAKGATWAPSYSVDVSDPAHARLSAKAEIVNEALDLDGVEVDLITGYPHLRFAGIVSPLALKQSLSEFLQSLGAGESEQAGRRMAVVTQNVAYYREAEQAFAPEYGAAEAGVTAEDLFLYPLHDVRLARGEVGYYPLFTESVPYEHVYQWEIPDYVNEEDRYGQPRPEERDQPEVVWHSLKLQNTTSVPWTTAPAQTVENGQVLGQDVLNYTPVGGQNTLRITQAVSVKAEQVESEVEREREALRMYGWVYDRVTVQGRLAVTSFKRGEITVEVTKTLSGEVRSCEPQAEARQLARGLRRVNPVSVLTWRTKLQPGERSEIEYTYQVLVQR